MGKLTNLQKDQKAADLYLEHWQLCEKPNSPNDKNYVGDEEVIRDMYRQDEIVKELKTLGFPNPNDIVYDNEAVPYVHWKSDNFDCDAYYESKWDGSNIDDDDEDFHEDTPSLPNTFNGSPTDY